MERTGAIRTRIILIERVEEQQEQRGPAFRSHLDAVARRESSESCHVVQMGTERSWTC
jgi:hypothetical protein